MKSVNSPFYVFSVVFVTQSLGFLLSIPSSRAQSFSPPRVDPLSSTTDLIPSPYSLSLNGPRITTNFNGVSAKSALQMLADLAGYDFVYVKSNPYIVPHQLTHLVLLLGKISLLGSLHALIRFFLHLDLRSQRHRIRKE